MKKIIAIICLLCCIFLYACAKDITNDGNQSNDDNSSSGSEELPAEPQKIVLSNGLTAAYDIILPLDCSTELRTAAQSLATKLQNLTGALFRVTSDDAMPSASKGEILIGFCDRDDTRSTLNGVMYKDYKISVTDKSIVIGAYSDDSAIDGVFRFMGLLKKDSITKDGSKMVFVFEKDISYKHTYSMPNANVKGVDIGKYCIVIPSNESNNKALTALAKKLQVMIGSHTGKYLNIVSDSTPATQYELLFGTTSRPESQGEELLKYSVSISGSKIVFESGGIFSLERAVEAYESKLIQSGGAFEKAVMEKNLATESYPTRANSSDYRIMEYNVLVEFEGWGSEKSDKLNPDVNVRREIVASTVLGYSPDVIVFCELYDNWRNGLIPMLDSDYSGVCLDRADGNSNPMPILYRKDKFTLIDSGYTEIDTIAINRRVVTWAVLKDRITNEQLLVFGTHLSSLAPSGQSLADKQCSEIDKITPVINSVKSRYNGSVIFTGDFNCTANTRPYNYIHTKTGLSSVTEGEASKLGIVDHIFADSSVSAVKVYINYNNCGDYASDHRPVVCDIKVGN